MDFTLSDDQRDILDLVKEFATNEVLPRASVIDENAQYPADLVSKMGELGLMGVPFPEKYGGAAQSYVTFALIVEELCRACASTGLIMDVNISLCGEPILMFGTEEQKQKFLRPLATGEKLGALAMTEPEAGSDAASIKTSAVKSDGGFVLNGRKIFITNGEVADTYVVTAVTDRNTGTSGITNFIVEKSMPGVSFTTHYEKMGIRGAPTTDVVLENVEVPQENVLGGEGNGFKVTMDTLDAGRIGIAAQAVGIARAALEDCLHYIQQRQQFGRSISEFQAIQFMVADMAVGVQAARNLMLRAAFMRDNHIPCARESSMAKLFAGDTAMRVTTEAVQVFGGYGYMQEYPVERHMRDAKITQIYEGTQQIQRLVIARQVMGGR
ncbi:MAG: acyl-CoA dehydrogenase AcdA [Chloroflexota bacterium]